MANWRNTEEYREWRKDVIRACDYKCNVCSSVDSLHAHHVLHSSYYKELRFSVDNGVAMCDTCHIQFHNNFKRNTRNTCDAKDYQNFKSLASYFSKK